MLHTVHTTTATPVLTPEGRADLDAAIVRAEGEGNAAMHLLSCRIRSRADGQPVPDGDQRLLDLLIALVNGLASCGDDTDRHACTAILIAALRRTTSGRAS